MFMLKDTTNASDETQTRDFKSSSVTPSCHTPPFINGPRREKACLWWFANNKDADQPARPRSLISAFVIRLLESIISRLATGKFQFKS